MVNRGPPPKGPPELRRSPQNEDAIAGAVVSTPTKATTARTHCLTAMITLLSVIISNACVFRRFCESLRLEEGFWMGIWSNFEDEGSTWREARAVLRIRQPGHRTGRLV